MILGNNGRRLVEFGGSRAWLQRTKNDIVCSFQWLDIGGEEPSACMCLFPTTLRMNGGTYVIPQENAHAFGTPNGHPTPHLIGAAFKAAVQMGFFPDKTTVHRIVDVVIEGLPDLIRMPSSQPETLAIKRAVQGIEVNVGANGKTFAQHVI